jgi:hypothetical protein
MVYTFGHGNHGSTMVFYTMCRTVRGRRSGVGRFDWPGNHSKQHVDFVFRTEKITR